MAQITILAPEGLERRKIDRRKLHPGTPEVLQCWEESNVREQQANVLAAYRTALERVLRHNSRPQDAA